MLHPAPSVSHAIDALCARGMVRLDAQMLMLHLLGKPVHQRAWLLAHGDTPLTSAQAAQLEHLAQRRFDGEPLAYLTGHKEFYGLTLQVDARVLDPRADTETLVDWALALPLGAHAQVLDLGTGSGAIALALKHQRPTWQVQALDASTDALAVAGANAQRLGLDVALVHANWLKGVHGRFDLIASNPPYIAAQDAHLDALRHEPLAALASGADGLDAIRTIVTQSVLHLYPGGWLLLEHGYDQAHAVRALLHSAGFSDVQSRSDLAGIARCSGGRWGASNGQRIPCGNQP